MGDLLIIEKSVTPRAVPSPHIILVTGALMPTPSTPVPVPSQPPAV